MAEAKYSAYSAMREHLLEGHKISLLEALLLFGVQSPNRALTSMKRDGFYIKSQKVAMAKIIRRINEYTKCEVPNNLPYTEITMMEYWISR